MSCRFWGELLKRDAWFTTIVGRKGKLGSKGLEFYTLQNSLHHHPFLFLHVSPKTTQRIPATPLLHNPQPTTLFSYPKSLFNLNFPVFQQWNPMPPIQTLIPITAITATTTTTTRLDSNPANPSPTG